MFQFRPRHAVWLFVYAAVMVALVGYLVHLRSVQMDRLSQPAARQAWETWREAAKQQAGDAGPVKRKVPKSSEPPALVLLRDHFPVVVTAGLVFGSALFGLAALTIYGTLSGGQQPRSVARADAHTDAQSTEVEDPQS